MEVGECKCLLNRVNAAAAAFEIKLSKEMLEAAGPTAKTRYVFIAPNKDIVQEWVRDCMRCCPGGLAHAESLAYTPL